MSEQESSKLKDNNLNKKSTVGPVIKFEQGSCCCSIDCPECKIDLKKRDSLKKAIIGGAAIGVGIIGLGSVANAEVIFRSGSTSQTLTQIAGLANSDVPIGGVIGWAKSLTGVPALPANWVECNGGTVNVVGSPMNGTAIPDLNGASTTQRYLKGCTTSGATGGVVGGCHSHCESGFGCYICYCSGASTSLQFLCCCCYRNTCCCCAEPPYYTVVWVMRVL